jgi:hypothetical protein
MSITKCAIIGYDLKTEELKPVVNTTIEYETEYVGKVNITLSAYNELLDGEHEQRWTIAGICLQRTLDKEEPVLIDSEFIRTGYKKHNPPIEFEEKCFALLRRIYKMGGRENKSFEFHTGRVFALAYANYEEFGRILDQLISDNLLNFSKSQSLSRNHVKMYFGVKLSSLGKLEAEKALPKMPMFGLISQKITTGDAEIDNTINTAKELFFSDPTSMDKKRSACETLSFVLEPLRKDLANYFTTSDVSDFFNIVNNFDIRHNKNSTKNIQTEEQLEWVFYTLLNTINTYTKLKSKGNI